MRNILLCCTLAVLLSACKGDDEQSQPFEGPFLPANFPAPAYDLSANPVTEAGFALGKKLFYDKLLSRDTSIACSDCHISFSAFSHPDHATSHGIDNLFGKRNALPIQNMLWQREFFWDGGVPHLDLVPLNAIQSAVEMDEKPSRVLEKLKAHPQYPGMFAAAFGSPDISTARFLQALAQFSAMLVSANSPYDRYVRQENGATLSAAESEGLSLFRQHCASCHSTELFSDQSFRNNGILSEFSLDRGRQEVSTLPDDLGKFRVPSLRNVAATGPYMHNGKFKTLEAVLQHYAGGVKDSPTLDPLLRRPDGSLGIPLGPAEQSKIIAFLKTLTDEAFLRDPRFAE
ncbi:MAG TPA: cytochrome c peroxidase [Saprospiraceae bacterium]|nr:cytochrome c peroxidase [Saprospiraceae bacterium]